MKCRVYEHFYRAFGVVLSRDCVLSQYEPYELVSRWEPHLCIYLGKRMVKVWCEVKVDSWLGRKFGRWRHEQDWMRYDPPLTEAEMEEF